MADPLEDFDKSDAVQFRNCSKGYNSSIRWNCERSKRQVVFDNIDLTVPRGVTYALLGPSGCGKTTLLKCMMGRLQVDSGTIGIFGRQLGLGDRVTGSKLGYMPQELALFDLLTIEQTLNYFGKILGLSNAFIKFRIQFFVKFLKLPRKNTMNNKLSGGQLRRLSFAVATMHQPRLLILDEPTVGVDPIVRERMWRYLRFIKKCNSTTVILTTHYLEEARSANLIGFMHNGRMLAEGSPVHLMRVWNVTTLEDLFYQVCVNHSEKRSDQDDRGDAIPCNQSDSENSAAYLASGVEVQDEYETDIAEWNEQPTHLATGNHCSKQSNCFNFDRLAPLVKKNFINFLKFPFALSYLIAFPAILVAVMLIVTTGDILDLDVAIINIDNGPYGNMYLDVLDDKLIKQVPYESYQEGYQDVMAGKYLALIFIERNFSDNFSNKFLNLNVLKNGFPQGININVTLDNTDLVLSKTVMFHLLTKFVDFTAKSLEEVGLSSKLSNGFLELHLQPIELIGEPILATSLPTIIISMMFVAQATSSVLFLYMEKSSGYLERNLVLGVTVTEIIISYIVIQSFICILQSLVVLIMAFAILNAPLIGSMGPVIVMAILSGLVGMSSGLLVSSFFNDLMKIGNVAYSLILIIIAISGMFMPLEASPTVFYYISACFPFHVPSRALANIMYRDLGLFDVNVLPALGMMLLWFVVQIFLSIISLHNSIIVEFLFQRVFPM